MLGDPTGQLDVVGGEAALERHPDVGRPPARTARGRCPARVRRRAPRAPPPARRSARRGPAGRCRRRACRAAPTRSGATSPAAGTAGCARGRPVRPSTGRPAPPSDRSTSPGSNPSTSSTVSAARRSNSPANTESSAKPRRWRASSSVQRPLDGGAQRLVPRWDLAAAGQPVEPLAQRRQQPVRAQRPHPRRGQLDGERQPVETLADGTHRRVLVGRDDPPASAARRRKRSTAPPDPAIPTGSGWTGHTRSPSTSSGWRLVATTVTDDELRRIVATTSAAASRTCSQLSTTISPLQPTGDGALELLDGVVRPAREVQGLAHAPSPRPTAR